MNSTEQVLHSHGQIHKACVVKLPHPKPSIETEGGKQLRLLLSINSLHCGGRLIKYNILGSNDETLLYSL